MYGTKDEYSDTDKLFIYIPSIEDDISFTTTHHQFQYKKNNIDYLFINIYDFIRNSLNGDSTINFEIICSEKLKGSYLEFLYDMRLAFHNYKTIRSYLGLCRRDIKYLNKSGTSERDKNKKLGHILRGYSFAKSILDRNFTPQIKGDLYDKITEIKTYNFEKRLELTNILRDKISNLRDDVNMMLDNNNLNLPSYMTEENQQILDKHLKKLYKSDIWSNKKKEKLGLLNLVYNTNESRE